MACGPPGGDRVTVTRLVGLSGRGGGCAIDAPIALHDQWSTWGRPYLRAAEGGAFPPLRVSVAEQPLTNSPAEARPVQLHSGHTGLLWSGREGALEVRNVSVSAHYTVSENGGLRFLYGPAAARNVAALDAFQLVRGLMCAEAEHRGWRRAHLSAVDVEGVGVAFVGPSGAGKTSFALGLLRSRQGTRFVTNDKAHVPATPKYGVAVCGLPLAAAVSVDCLPSLPEVPTDGNRLIDGKLYVWPDVLAAALGTSCAASTTLSLVCTCELRLDDDTVHSKPLPRAAVAANIDGPANQHRDSVTPHWLLEQLFPASEIGPPTALGEVTWLSIEGNPWSPGWPRLLDDLLESGITS